MNDKERRQIANAKWPVLVDRVFHHGPWCECGWCCTPVPVKRAKLRKDPK